MAQTAGRLRVARRETTSRHVSWLELFFDLVFVAAVARLGYLLHADPTPAGLAVFLALFVPVWWAWLSFSYYADLFGDETLVQRLAQLAAMLGAALLAISLYEGVADDSTVFAGTMAGLLLLLAALYEHARRSEPAVRALAGWYVAGSLAGAAGWLVSLAVAAPARYVVWAVALAVNMVVSGPLAYARTADVPRQVSHMPERFGLFTIVVLGESLLAVVNGTIDTSWRPVAVVTALAGFVIAATLWWVYFAQFDERLIDRALAGGRHTQLVSFWYGYGHLPVYAALAAVGIGIELAIEAAAEPDLTAAARLTLAGGAAVYLAVLTGLQLAAGRRLSRPVVAWKITAVLALLAVIPLPLSAIGAVTVVAGVLVITPLVSALLPRR